MSGPKKFSPSSFGAVVGSGIDKKNQLSGNGIRHKHTGSATLPLGIFLLTIPPPPYTTVSGGTIQSPSDKPEVVQDKFPLKVDKT